MVEENEIRADLSFYERAKIVHRAVRVGGLSRRQCGREEPLRACAACRGGRRSSSSYVLRRSLGSVLRFPAAIPEKLGLALATAIEADKAVAVRIIDALRKTPAVDAAGERRVLERALKGPASPKAGREEIAPGVLLEAGKGRAVLSGKAVDTAFLDGLRAWAAKR